MYAIIIANRYPDIIQPLLDSIKQKTNDCQKIIIVKDGHNNDYGYFGVRYTEPHFVYSKAINLGIAQTGRYDDLFLINDDCKILEWNFFNRLRDWAYSRPEVGILSPIIYGCVGGQGEQRFWEQSKWWAIDEDFKDINDPHPVCFPCVFIKRKLIDDIGLLDETKVSYGGDDVEYCERARAAGWKTSITQRIVVQHADGTPALGDGRGKSWATSYMKRWPGRGTPSQEEIDAYLVRNKLKL